MNIDYGISLGIIILFIICILRQRNYKSIYGNADEMLALPKEITPAEAVFIMHGGNCSSYGILCQIYEWINKGWISLYDSHNMTVLRRDSDIDEKNPDYEKELFYYLFPDIYSVRYSMELKADIRDCIPYFVKKANEYYSEYYKVHTRLQNLMKLILVSIGLVPLLSAVLQRGNDYNGLDGTADMLCVALILFIVPAFIALFTSNHTLKRVLCEKQSYPLLLFLVIFIFGMTAFYCSLRNIDFLILIREFLFQFILSSLNIILTASMPPFSKSFNRKRTKILQFKRNLMHSHNKTIDTLSEKSEKSYFYSQDMLPYMLALDIVPIEHQKFLNLIKEDINIETMQFTADFISQFMNFFL